MVTNTASVVHDAYTLENTNATCTKNKIVSKRELTQNHTLKSNLYQSRREIMILQP